MTTPLRKPHPTHVSFEFRGFEFEESSEINPPNLCSDTVVRQILPASLLRPFQQSTEQIN
jgi:hypothetical protein